MNTSTRKLCEITDIIPVKVFPDRPKKRGPIRPMYMSDDLILSILTSNPAPKHFYALDPNNKNKKVLLTKENYFRTPNELFGYVPISKIESTDKKVEEVVEEPQTPIEEPVVNETSDVDNVVEEPVDEVNEIITDVNEVAEATTEEAVVEEAVNETVIDINDIDIENDANVTTDTSSNEANSQPQQYPNYYKKNKKRK